MRNRLISLGVMALVAMVGWAGHAGAVTDRLLSERGHMSPPAADVLFPNIHVNQMMQDQFADAGGAPNRTVTHFAESLVKTRALIPGASLPSGPLTLINGNVLSLSGRGIGFSHFQVHDPLTGEIVWQTPIYLGTIDTITGRTVHPWAIANYSTIDIEGNLYVDDAYHMFSFTEDGILRWRVSHADLPPGPQRVQEEPLKLNNMRDDWQASSITAPDAIRSPLGNNITGGTYSRGNIVFYDMENGSVAALDAPDPPHQGVNAPFIFAIVELVCFGGGEISNEIKDLCVTAAVTRYYSVNTTVQHPTDNQFTFTYAGDGETFDQLISWRFVTDGGPNQPGNLLSGDLNGDGFPDEGIEEAWRVQFGLNSGATPSISETLGAVLTTDGNGINYVIDSQTGTILQTAPGGLGAFSPAVDYENNIGVCSGGLGLGLIDSATGADIWFQKVEGLGIGTIPILPDAPLAADGRPSEACTGIRTVHADVLQAQYVVGYPIALFEALEDLGAPLPSTITSTATVDIQAHRLTGAVPDPDFRSIYTGSGEAQVLALESGYMTSTRVDAVASINAGLVNLITPSRFDVPPAQGGWVVAQPVSFREDLRNQLVGAEMFCQQVLNSLPSADPPTLQIAQNKMGYINAIMKHSMSGRIESAKSREPSELNTIGEAGLNAIIDAVILNTTAAKVSILDNAPGDPVDNGLGAKVFLELSCEAIAAGIVLMSIPAVAPPRPLPPDPGADTCLVQYDLTASFQISDTPGGAGDGLFNGLEGSMILRYAADAPAGNIIDGRVEMAWVWVHQDFTVNSPGVDVITDVHNFSPSCNGESDPSWTPATIPPSCDATGVDLVNDTVAMGQLDSLQQAILWQNCLTAPTYWGDDNGAFTTADAMAASGRGCIALKGPDENTILPITQWHSYGNVFCDGAKITCGPGGLQVGDNIQELQWPQALINGKPGGGANGLIVSADPSRSTVTFPGTDTTGGPGADGGFQSINIPNDNPSRTWMGVTGVRNDVSGVTDCN